jgi:hypothetical protein
MKIMKLAWVAMLAAFALVPSFLGCGSGGKENQGDIPLDPIGPTAMTMGQSLTGIERHETLSSQS